MPQACPTEYEAWLRLTLIPGIGAATLRKLLAQFGSPEDVLAASHAALEPLVGANAAAHIRSDVSAAAAALALAWLDDPINQIVTLADEHYPQLLLETPDPPIVLYVKGRRHLLNQPALAIVGSRNATAQGKANAEAFARALSDAGITIVSGLAVGIDTAAHRGGLAGSASSIGVIGTGLDIVYPARNRELAHELAAGGALVSEFPLGTPPLAANFPRRNRVISGMSRGCLVVEAALQSGSLITARLANEQGREVFALPGSIHAPLAKGCHQLIKQGAKLVDAVSDILDELHFTAGAPPAALASAPEDDAAHALLDALGHEPHALDALCASLGWGADKLATLLLDLELRGLVEPLPGGLYQRVY